MIKSPFGFTNLGFKKVYSGITLNMSTVNGSAFITNVSGSIPFYLFLNRFISISDGVNTVTGFIKAAGTGETLDTELLTNGNFAAWTGDNPNNWTLDFVEDANNYITENVGKARVVTNAQKGIIYQAAFAGVGCLHQVITTINTFTSGNMIISERGVANLATYTTSGVKTAYWTEKITNLFLFFAYVAGANDFLLTSISIKKVLSPSITGVTIVSARGGSTQNWTSNGGINPAAASFTVTILA